MPTLPAGVDESTLEKAFQANTGFGRATAPAPPPKKAAPTPPPSDTNLGNVVAGGKVVPTQGTEQQPFRLGQAETQVLQPYIDQLNQLLGPSGQSATSGLTEYLKNLPPGIASTIQKGLGAEMQALSGIGPAIGQQAQQAGQAGELTNLLNAARYQEIYKQALYGTAPPTNTPLGQLYQQVVTGGNELTGALPAVSPTGTPAPTPTAAKGPNLNASAAPVGAPANPNIRQVFGTYVWNGQAWVQNG